MRIFAPVLACAALVAPALCLAKAPATERTEAFIAHLLKVKQDDGKLTPADKQANGKVFTQLDGFFDFDSLTQEPISPRADKFTPAQKAEFTQKFRELIRLVAYPDSGEFFKKATCQVSAPKEQGDLAVVLIDAKVPKDDLETKVEIFWKKTAQGLKLTDVAFDGDSLVKDYTNQFVRIIDKEGPQGLIGKIDKRRAELEPKK